MRIAESDSPPYRLKGASICPFVGASDALVAALQQLRQVARCEAPVLIEGETGTGKELAARAIHYGGARRDGPFVPVNCGAIPEALVESELFGHERGAFTDAREKRTGLVAEARGGTLFLDEVDALNAKAQVTLLRFLQDQRYRPVGTPREQRGDVRVIASTNRPLDALTEAGQFRADLLYRLKVLHLVMPPLRDRGDDAALLAHHFVARFVAQYRMPTKTLHPDALAWLRRQSWPGNVRELENWVHRALLMATGDTIGLDTAPAGRADGAPAMRDLISFAQAKAEAVRRFEHDYLCRALALGGGCVARAARLAGKERRAFGKLLKKHGLAHGSPVGTGADPHGAPLSPHGA
jgi:two-component system, NtrC family, response regulator GlrR